MNESNEIIVNLLEKDISAEEILNEILELRTLLRKNMEDLNFWSISIRQCDLDKVESQQAILTKTLENKILKKIPKIYGMDIIVRSD